MMVAVTVTVRYEAYILSIVGNFDSFSVASGFICLHRLNIISYVDKIDIDQGGPIYVSHKTKTNSRCLQIPSET